MNIVGIPPQKFLVNYCDYVDNYYDDVENDYIDYENGYFAPYKRGSRFEAPHKIFEPTIHVDNTGNRTVTSGHGFYTLNKG